MTILTFDFERKIMQEIDQIGRSNRLQPIFIGGVGGPGGGTTTGPITIRGQIPQSKIALDTTESCASGVAPSGSLVHNLNRIRGGWAICDGAIKSRHLSLEISQRFHPGNTAIVASSGGDFTSIQAGIDYVVGLGGGLVVIYPGTYVENLTLSGGVYLYAMTNVAVAPSSGVAVTAPSSGNIAIYGVQINGAASQPCLYYPPGSTAVINLTSCRLIAGSGGTAITGNQSSGNLQFIDSVISNGDLLAPSTYAEIRGGNIGYNVTLPSGGNFFNLPKIYGTITGAFDGLYQNVNDQIKGPGFIFTSLEDVPSTYASHKLKVPRVKFDETGLEFVIASGGGGGAITFTQLTDVPNSYTDHKLKVPRVKFDETGLEFVIASGGGGTGSPGGSNQQVQYNNSGLFGGSLLLYDNASEPASAVFITGNDGDDGVDFDLSAGNATNAGTGGSFNLSAGTGGSTGIAGNITISAGTGGASSGNGGDIIFEPGAAVSGTNGRIRITDPSGSGYNGSIVLQTLTLSNKTYTFPNATGTVALTSNLPVGADPTASVGLTAVNGAAATFMRSDAAPALSVAIVPTWTGIHTFGNTTDSTSTSTGSIISSGGVGIAKALNVGTVVGIGTNSGSTVGLAVLNSTTAANLFVSDSGTNNQPSVATFRHYTSGTPAAGFGVDTWWMAHSSDNTDRAQGLIRTRWTTATDASRKATMDIYVYDTAARQAIQLATNGSNVFTTFPDTTDTTGSTDGAVIISGGLGIAKMLNVGTTVGIGTAATTTTAIRAINGTTGAQLYTGDAGTNNITTTLQIVHNTSDAANVVAGFGIQTGYYLNSTTTSTTVVALDRTEWVDPTHASRKARRSFFVYDTVGREYMRAEGDGSAVKIGFFGAGSVVKQTSGANLTNNVTSGGTTDTIDNWTNLTTYSTDAAAIRNAVYQLARKLKQINDGLRQYGLFT